MYIDRNEMVLLKKFSCERHCSKTKNSWVEIWYFSVNTHLSTDHMIDIYLPYSTSLWKSNHHSFSSISNTLCALRKCQWFAQGFHSNVHTSSSSYFLEKISKYHNLISIYLQCMTRSATQSEDWVLEKYLNTTIWQR